MVVDYEKSEEIAEKAATWLDEHTRKARRLAYSFCQRHRTNALVARVYSLINRLYKPQRLVMRSTCPGCRNDYWEGR